LRGPKQNCSHNPNEVSAFGPELGLRDVPWKSAQWSWQAQRLRLPLLSAAIFNAPRDEVVRIPLSPRFLLLLAARGLAFRSSAGLLT
jgi:hypothetical protein